MVKHAYRFNRKRMYLEPEVFHKVVDHGVSWDEIQREADRIMRTISLSTPRKGFHNEAAIILLADKLNSDTVRRSISVVNSNDKKLYNRGARI